MLSHTRLLQLIEYLPESGFFIWRKTRGKVKGGSVAGSLHVSRTRANYCYVAIKIDGKEYAAHRLAWFYMTGMMPHPDVQIDHHDGSSCNNRWSNLRPATHTQNQWSRGANRTSGTGLRGVTPNGKRWRARISVNGKRIDLGVFDSKWAAAAAYKRASEQHHGEFACR